MVAALRQPGYVSGGFIGLLLVVQAQVVFLLFHSLFCVPSVSLEHGCAAPRATSSFMKEEEAIRNYRELPQ
jgi:hypothetical protein